MRNAIVLALLVVVLLAGGCADLLSRSRGKGPALAHNVYFALNDNSAAAQAKLVDECYKYLKDHPGVTFFAAGTLVAEHDREVNVRDWDVGLHVVFASKEHHDLYQTAADHQTFIDRNKDNWKTVRVFDTSIKK